MSENSSKEIPFGMSGPVAGSVETGRPPRMARGDPGLSTIDDTLGGQPTRLSE